MAKAERNKIDGSKAKTGKKKSIADHESAGQQLKVMK
jgi:hypothetical protein